MAMLSEHIAMLAQQIVNGWFCFVNYFVSPFC
jgi:hypothetical protein